MNLIVTDSTFSGNRATVAGGAVRTRRQSTFTDVDFVDNTAGNGAAYQSTDLLGATFTRGSFLRNVAAASDGAALRYFVLTATDVDFGTGADDNTPHDLSDGGANQYDFSGVVSVSCNGTCTTP